MSYKEIDRGAYKIKIEAPEIYVDNEKRGRSGHMSHAFAEFKKGQFIEFNSNCSATRCGGHSAGSLLSDGTGKRTRAGC